MPGSEGQHWTVPHVIAWSNLGEKVRRKKCVYIYIFIIIINNTNNNNHYNHPKLKSEVRLATGRDGVELIADECRQAAIGFRGLGLSV